MDNYVTWHDGSARACARRRARAQADEGRGLALDAAVRMLAEAGSPGATRQTLIGYESGTSVPEPARMALLARVFATTPAALSSVDPDRAHLSDLRHWAGLTADQAAASFGFSLWSMLRLGGEPHLRRVRPARRRDLRGRARRGARGLAAGARLRRTVRTPHP